MTHDHVFVTVAIRARHAGELYISMSVYNMTASLFSVTDKGEREIKGYRRRVISAHLMHTSWKQLVCRSPLQLVAKSEVTRHRSVISKGFSAKKEAASVRLTPTTFKEILQWQGPPKGNIWE